MSQLTALKDAAAQALPDLDLILGWRQGPGPLRTSPFLIREAKDLDRLVFGPACVNNLASQLANHRGKKVGIAVKGCDSRSVLQLVQEGLVSRESLVIFGLPCTGVVDFAKLAKVCDLDAADSLEVAGGEVRLAVGGKTVTLPRAEALADKCLVCRFPNPVDCDHLIGEPVEIAPQASLPSQEAFAALSLDERFQFWLGQMERCLRCYACRNSCPMCFCKDVCLADSRDPRWQSQETSVREKLMFQLVHAMHLAGRCTECGECERACPVNIPLMTMKRELAGIMRDLFSYDAGVDPKAKPPLLTFKVVEETIKETEW